MHRWENTWCACKHMKTFVVKIRTSFWFLSLIGGIKSSTALGEKRRTIFESINVYIPVKYIENIYDYSITKKNHMISVVWKIKHRIERLSKILSWRKPCGYCLREWTRRCAILEGMQNINDSITKRGVDEVGNLFPTIQFRIIDSWFFWVKLSVEQAASVKRGIPADRARNQQPCAVVQYGRCG